MLAADGDLWGISARTFATWYGVAVIALLAISLVVRYVALAGRSPGRTPGRPSGRSRTPSASEIALIIEGRSRAVHASLTALLVADAINVEPGSTLRATSPSASMSPLDAAVYDAVVRGRPLNDISWDARVRAALAEVESTVRSHGWLLTSAARARAEVGTWLLLALTVVGVARMVAVVMDGGTVRDFSAAVVIAGMAAWLFHDPPTISRAGKRAMASLYR